MAWVTLSKGRISSLEHMMEMAIMIMVIMTSSNRALRLNASMVAMRESVEAQAMITPHPSPVFVSDTGVTTST